MEKIIPFLEEQIGGTCYRSFKYCVDEREVPSVNYEDNRTYTLQRDRYGETDTSLKSTKDISGTAKQIEGNNPLFRYFLDGSRRIYKIDDIELGRKIFPIIGGQIGVACCERQSLSKFKCDIYLSVTSRFARDLYFRYNLFIQGINPRQQKGFPLQSLTKSFLMTA